MKTMAPHTRCTGCYGTRFGTAANVRAKEVANKAYFYNPSYIVHPAAVVGLLKEWGYNETETTTAPSFIWRIDALCVSHHNCAISMVTSASGFIPLRCDGKYDVETDMVWRHSQKGWTHR